MDYGMKVRKRNESVDPVSENKGKKSYSHMEESERCQIVSGSIQQE